jgi:hypothetical protein
MTPQQIAADVARGIQIKAEIARLLFELKAIEARLETAALEGEQIPLEDAEREGKQYLARGSDQIVPVRFESDQIAGSFDPDSSMHQAATLIAAGQLDKFYKDTRKFIRVPKDGNAFRKLARQLLTSRAFADLIQACTVRNKAGMAQSKTVIAWDDAKPIDQSVVLAP